MATFLRTRAIASVPSSGGDSLLTYFWDSAGGTPTQVMTEAQARVRAFWSSFAAFFPSTGSVIFDPVGDEVEETTGQIVGQFTAPGVANVNGTGPGERLPYQTQGLIQLRTGLFRDGRRVQGRQFIPLPAETDSTSGFPNPAYVAGLQTAANLLGTTIVTPIAQRVWSRPREASIALPSRAGLSTPVTARKVSAQWAVLRSRRA